MANATDTPTTPTPNQTSETWAQTQARLAAEARERQFDAWEAETFARFPKRRRLED